MNNVLDDDSRKELVDYRLRRSEETLDEADCLAENGHYSGALNRLYYACYYLVSALLIANKLQATTHSGVKSLFARNFIKSGKIDLAYGKFFNEIFEIRHSNDYDDFIFCDESTYIYYRPKVDGLKEHICAIMQN